MLDQGNVNLDKMVAITTDGAPAMTSEKVDVVGNFKQIITGISSFHCAIHQFNLMVKKIGLEDTMSLVTKIVTV